MTPRKAKAKKAESPIRKLILDGLPDDGETEVIFYEPAQLDAAIVGVTWPMCNRSTICVVYDYEKMIAVFIADGMSDEEAREWMSFNTLDAWLGDNTPIIIDVLNGTGPAPAGDATPAAVA